MVKILSNCLVYTNVYGRNVLAHLKNDIIERIRVIADVEQLGIGTIAIGRVCKLLPSSNACFVELADGMQYFCSIPSDISNVLFTDDRKHQCIKCEDTFVVQICSEAIKMKAASVSTEISLKGRYFVIERGKGLFFSKKISTVQKKKLSLPENINEYSKDYKILVRTECANDIDSQVLMDELNQLIIDFSHVFNEYKYSREKSVLYKSKDILLEIAREWIKFGPEEFITDLYEDLDVDIFEIPIRRYIDENLPLCKLYKLETLIDEILSSKVYMKSGAFLVVEQGETLTAIDVNSGHAISGNKEEAILQINLEAVEYISKLLIQRNLSGMIVVDFINMKNRSSYSMLINKMNEFLKRDDIKSRYIDMTGLGLMEITRQRIYKSFKEQWKR